jgi:hypothetical protein
MAQNTPLMAQNTPLMAQNTPLMAQNTPLLAQNTPLLFQKAPLAAMSRSLVPVAWNTPLHVDTAPLQTYPPALPAENATLWAEPVPRQRRSILGDFFHATADPLPPWKPATRKAFSKNDVLISKLPCETGQALEDMEQELTQQLACFGAIAKVTISGDSGKETCTAVVSFVESSAARAALKAGSFFFTNWSRNKTLLLPIKSRLDLLPERSRLDLDKSYLPAEEPCPKRPPMRDRRKELSVGNLPALNSTVEKDLIGLFRRFGPVQHVRLRYTVRKVSRTQGVLGVITFEREEAVSAAMQAGPIRFYGTRRLKLWQGKEAGKQPPKKRRLGEGKQQPGTGNFFVLLFKFMFCSVLTVIGLGNKFGNTLIFNRIQSTGILVVYLVPFFFF